MGNKTKMRDIGFADGWDAGSLERHLYEKTVDAGCKFKEERRDGETICVCDDAGLMYHVKAL